MKQVETRLLFEFSPSLYFIFETEKEVKFYQLLKKEIA